MIQLIEPKFSDLVFKQELLADENTMSYNKNYGGTIDFNRNRWVSWYERWIGNRDSHYFYRYLYSEKFNTFVGEVAYHYDDESDRYLCDVIVHAKYRGNGFGKIGLSLLCENAKKNGLEILYDEILIDNPSIHLFLKNGFEMINQTKKVYVVRKIL